MSLNSQINVNTSYTRSINIERDRGSAGLVDTYLPTTQGVEVLEDVVGALSAKDRPRAWTLVGPYGSGKSSFALFLHELLGPAGYAKKAAKKVLAGVRPDLARRFTRKSECFRVALTGSNEPLASRLLEAIDEAATVYWSGARGRKPQVLTEIRRMRKCQRVTESELLNVLDKLQSAVERNGASGFLIVIDELGKFLEYETRHSDSGVFLLQQLAERAYRSRRANLMLFVLLHQGIDLYAKGMGEKVKNDWAKVQGRFQSLSFVETTEQTLRIVARAFSNSLTPTEQELIASRVEPIMVALDKAEALPQSLSAQDARLIFSSCYPIHPISLLLLPKLCQRFAQNERTLFSYLASREPHGFQSSLMSIEKLGDWVPPSEIHDYFVQNQHAVLADPLVHRRWAEVSAAIERAEEKHDVSAAANAETSSPLMLAKTIGVLNLISRTGGLRASDDVLKLLFDDEGEYQRALCSLLDLSIIQYRRFSDEYRVWQGTDFDIDQRTQEEADKIGMFDLAESLTDREAATPVLARRHSIHTGALRYFSITFVGSGQNPPKATGLTDPPRIVIYLCETTADETGFQEAISGAGPNEIWVNYSETTAIRSAITEVIALEGVARSSQELSADPVAAKEVRERLLVAKLTERDVVKNFMGDPSRSEWYWRNERLEIKSTQQLQQVLSRVMDTIFSNSPIIRNELICRNKISSQAAAARNKLFLHMLNHEEEPQLGIDKYPAERTIYRSIFEKGRLHASFDSQWVFRAPEGKDPLNLAPTWARIGELFAGTEEAPKTLEDFISELEKPPYGVKRGIVPVVFLHYYLLNQHEIAVYDGISYAPSLTYEHLERMVRRPDQYSFQRFRIEGVRKSLFNAYSKALFGEVRDSIPLLDIARPLSQFFMGLDEYTKVTRRLSETAISVRQAFFLSKSPEKLLFDELPYACGMKRQSDYSGFDEKLIETLRELQNATRQLYDSMRNALCESFGISNSMTLGELRNALRLRCSGLEEFSLDVDGLKSLIRRLCDAVPDDDHWFDRVLLFLGRKPISSWTDQDREFAEYRLVEFAKRLIEVEKIRLHYKSNPSENHGQETILLKTISSIEGEIDEVVSLNDCDEHVIAQASQRIQKELSDMENRELALAIVARLTKDFLTNYQRDSAQQTGVKNATD